MSSRDGRYAFLRSPRWLRVIALGVAVSLACVALGWWQWTRHTARAEAVARIAANYDAPPVPVADLLPPGGSLREGDAWRPAYASGSYLPDATVLLRNRPVSAGPAVHVLAPLLVEMPDGARAVLVVDRGWLPAGAEEDRARVPAPPSGSVTVRVHLRPAEAPSEREAPPGQAYTIDPVGVLAAVGESPVDASDQDVPGTYAVLDGYGVLSAEDPAAALAPSVLPRPSTSIGSHLSYTFQWWVFAVGALAGVVVLARREAAANDGPGSGAPRAPGRRTRPSAEEEEDALVDAALAVEPRPAGPGARAQPEAARVDPPRLRRGVSD